MARTSSSPKGDTFTFRLDPAMKSALASIAAEENKPPGELMRSLLEAHLNARQRRAFEAEARRQCLLINARKAKPDTDDAAVMQELAAHLDADDFGDEWKA
jgi:hypothetical protein